MSKGTNDAAAGPGKTAPAGLTDEEIAKRHQRRLRQALDDASLLIAFATESKRATSGEIIAQLVKAQSIYLEKHALAESEEVDFWNAYSTLTTSVLPATVEGIKGVVANKNLGFLGWMLRYPWISLPSIAALVLYVVVQIYTVQGSDILKQYQVTLDQIAQFKAQQVATKITAQAPQTTTINAQADSFQADDKVELLAAQLVRYQQMLAEWNNCPLYAGLFRCGGVVSRGDEEAVRSQITLNNVNASILPLILGLLGACTQVLRAISKRVIDQSMNPIFLPAYYVRLVLGMIIGATIGLFLQPSAVPNAENPFAFLSNLPLLTASFLAGYAVEILFSLMDKIVGDARSYISGNKPDTGQPPASK